MRFFILASIAWSLRTSFGATGLQGGGVVKALLRGGAYKVRAVTRNPSSDKAQALKQQGAEVVTADLDDAASVHKALEGASACFAVTNFWEHFDAEKETKQGKLLADASLATGVNHVVYSGLESVINSIGKSCPHFDSKAVVEGYMKEKAMPFTSVRLAAYLDNFCTNLKPQKLPDGTYVLALPMEGVRMHGIAVQDMGECVRSIMDSPEEFKGRCIGLATEYLTTQQYADIMSKVIAPKVVKDAQMTADQFSKLGFPGADDLAAMFLFYQKGNPDRDIALTKRLNPQALGFEQYLLANKEAFLNAIG